MTVIELISQAKKVRDELAAGRVVGACRATLPLQVFLFDTLEGIGIKEAATDAQKGELAEVMNEVEVEVKKIGDGQLLKLLLELFLKFGPIFL